MSEPKPIRVCYADPPYLGMGATYDHPDSKEWNKLSTHLALIERLVEQFPDGWAMSLHSPSLRTILPLCPADCRVAAWTKPFSSFKPGVGTAYAWEPVIFRGGRARPRGKRTVRDYLSANIALRTGFNGAKPEAFGFWIFEILGMEPTDEFVDLYPGSGAVSVAWRTWCRQQTGLFVDTHTEEAT